MPKTKVFSFLLKRNKNSVLSSIGNSYIPIFEKLYGDIIWILEKISSCLALDSDFNIFQQYENVKVCTMFHNIYLFFTLMFSCFLQETNLVRAYACYTLIFSPWNVITSLCTQFVNAFSESAFIYSISINYIISYIQFLWNHYYVYQVTFW